MRKIGSLREKKMLVSSAKRIKSNTFDTLQRSLIYIRKRSGPSIEPCGTPHSTYYLREFLVFWVSLCTISDASSATLSQITKKSLSLICTSPSLPINNDQSLGMPLLHLFFVDNAFKARKLCWTQTGKFQWRRWQSIKIPSSNLQYLDDKNNS